MRYSFRPSEDHAAERADGHAYYLTNAELLVNRSFVLFLHVQKSVQVRIRRIRLVLRQGGQRSAVGRKVDDDGRALVLLAADTDRAVMIAHDLIDDRKAKACAARAGT